MHQKNRVGTLYAHNIQRQNITGTLIIAFALFQLFFPLRHYFMTANPEWYGTANYFSWRMKMQSKEIVTLKMTLTDKKTGAYGPIEVKTFLSKNQMVHLVEDPDNLVQLARYLKPKAEKEMNVADAKITASAQVRFNGLPPQQMIDSTVDLSAMKRKTQAEKKWVLPLQELP